MSADRGPRPSRTATERPRPQRAEGTALRRGDLGPRIQTPPPGPRARALSLALEENEAPGINTLYGGAPALLWEEARGANVLDVDGNRFLDLTAGFGVAAVGHRHPAVVAAVRRQAGRLIHGLADVHAHPLRVALAERLVALAPFADARVHFAVSGAEAVEVALKTAALATSRPGVLAFGGAYHGLTLGALAATSRELFRAPFAAQLNPHLVRLPFGATETELHGALDAGDLGCVVVEPIQGREGVVLPPAGWLATLSRLARERGVLVVVDEILTGFGRTGTLWAGPADGLVPDLLCCGKALGGGLPIAAVLGRRELMATWATGGEARHTATFVAHPLACATALAVLDLLETHDLAGRARDLGALVTATTASWPQRFAPLVQSVRGRGLLQAVVLRDAATAADVTARALGRGVLLLAGGPEGRVAQIVPPLTITERQLSTALDLFAASLAAAVADETGR